MREAIFMGAITAAATHDMLNVLATIGQSAGLMEDLLSLSRREKIKTLGFGGGFKYHDKFKTTLEVIAQQVKRGLTLSENLNNFAHAPDYPVKKGDLSAAVDLLIGLTERQARSKRMRFVQVKGERAASGVNSLRLLMALFDVMQICLHMATGCTEIRITTKAREGEAVCLIDGDTGFADVSCALCEAALPLLDDLAQDGVRLMRESDGQLAVIFPAA